LEFSKIGLLCSSSAHPAIKELVLTESIPEESSIFFRKDTGLRIGFEAQDKFGYRKRYEHRVDYTKLQDIVVERAELLKLGHGCICYPFRECGAGVFHKTMSDEHQDLAGSPVNIDHFSQKEQTRLMTTLIMRKNGSMPQ